MSENHISWFHCGRCGSMFQSAAGDVDGRLCPECGRNPSLASDVFSLEPRPRWQEPADAPDQPSGHPGERKKRSRKNHPMVKLVGGWTLLFAAIILGARLLFHDDAGNRKPTVVESPLTMTLTSEEEAFVNETLPVCNQAFAGFLSAGTPEERNQFVLSPITTASRMSRYYELNPVANIDPSTLTPSKSVMLNLPGGKALETLWNSTDGRQLDAVFVKEADEWRLDWEHFVRYSDYPWPLFLAGSGADVGEFRLLARERLAEERKNDESISIVLYSPRFGNANETGFQSPEFLINRSSENGRLLETAFKMEKNGERVYGVKLSSPNPEGLIRVRVKVRRIEENMERRFELEKVVACHWYSTDDAGVKPAEPQAVQTPEK